MASFNFPLSNQDDYKGRIKFDVWKTIPPSLGKRSVSILEATLNGSDTELEGSNPDLNDPSQPQNRVVTASREVRTGNTCSIYLPQSIQIQDGVALENVDLNVFGTSLQRGLQSGSGPLEALFNSTSETVGSITDFFKGNVSQDAARAAVSRLSGFASDTVSGAVRSALQTTPAPNTRAIFKSVNLREFSFSFNMIPKSKREAEEIKRIVQFFRTELYPETIEVGGIPVAYKFPNKFAISIEYDNKKVATGILKSYLRNFQTNYNPSSMAFFEDGNFQEIQISMSFVEARTLEKKDIQRGF